VILQLQTPQELWPERTGVLKLLVETSQGLLGILPRHRDCLVLVYPGILTIEGEQLEHLAVHRGILVKRGHRVVLSARELVGGDLASLTRLVQAQPLRRQQSEVTGRSVQARLESTFARRFLELRQP